MMMNSLASLDHPSLPPLHGRESELAEIYHRLADPACRLLTLAGPGGMGKTRLAVEIAQNPSPQHLTFFNHDDGIYFVSLQAVTSHDFMIPALADALHFRFYGDHDPRHQLLEHLRGCSMLLILDNFEHLMTPEALELISQLLAHAPRIRLLVTSRERLNLLEEWVIELQGLSYPRSEVVVHDDDITPYAAVQFFEQRARQVQTGFRLNHHNRADVARICRLVEGMPLALELAAGWTRVLSCGEIADQIAAGLDILTSSARNAAGRHHSMRATLEYSWEMLTQTEQRVFQRLSVFRGGMTRPAAETVAGATLPLLTSLVDKSWLHWDEPRGRYTIHELLRQYGDERLQQQDVDWQTAHDRHCRYYADWMRIQGSNLSGSQTLTALQAMETELDNLRVGWQWAVEHQDLEAIEISLDSLWFFYDTGSRFHEGEQAFAAAVAGLQQRAHTDPGRTSITIGKVLLRQGSLLSSLDRHEEAHHLIQTGLDLLEKGSGAQRDLDDLAFGYFRMGVTTFWKTDYTASRLCFQTARELYQRVGNAWGTGHTCFWNGIVEEFTGNLDLASRLYQDSLIIHEQWHHSIGIAAVKSQIGQMLYHQGHYAEAQRLIREGLGVFEEAGVMWGISMSHDRLCLTLMAAGAYDTALHHALQSLKIAIQYDLKSHQLLALGRIARLWVFQNRLEPAVELMSLLVLSLDPASGSRYQHLLGEIRDRLPPAVFATAFERGQTRPLTQLTVEVLAALQTPPAAVPVQTLPDPLTGRELEVLRLMAQGFSNREIARRLVLALGTVKRYLNDIYSKLAVSSRVQAVNRARELNLL